MTSLRPAGSVNRLDLVIGDPDDEEEDFPTLTVLIDGYDALHQVGDRWFKGFEAAEILGPESPLLPIVPARRVAVYRCVCGIADDGVVAPMIERRSDDTIVWTDFRDYTGVFSGPTVLGDPGGGVGLEQSDLVFDADQYLDEVRRASADRRWESERRRTADVAHRLMRAAAPLGTVYSVDGVTPDRSTPDTWLVTLYSNSTASHHQLVVELTETDGAPQVRAQRMLDTLRDTPPEQWPVFFDSREPRKRRGRPGVS